MEGEASEHFEVSADEELARHGCGLGALRITKRNCVFLEVVCEEEAKAGGRSEWVGWRWKKAPIGREVFCGVAQHRASVSGAAPRHGGGISEQLPNTFNCSFLDVKRSREKVKKSLKHDSHVPSLSSEIAIGYMYSYRPFLIPVLPPRSLASDSEKRQSTAANVLLYCFWETKFGQILLALFNTKSHLFRQYSQTQVLQNLTTSVFVQDGRH